MCIRDRSGIRPDLDEYLTHKTVKRSDFLKYKTLAEAVETRRAWYEPTPVSYTHLDVYKRQTTHW